MDAEHKFLEALARGGMVFDGAMGTALYAQGILYNQCFEEQNLTRGDVVRRVHEAYVRAGAQAIETNTFGANRVRLATHGLQDKVVEINRAAVKLAREAAGGAAFVVASVGPTGLALSEASEVDLEPVREAIAEQVRALVLEGVDAIALETFRQPSELRAALEATRSALGAAPVPIIALVSVDEQGQLADGSEPDAVAKLAVEAGANAVGVNCSDGPAGVFRAATRMLGAGVPVVVMPNAGLPHRVDGRLAYMATPEYFLTFARRFFKAGIKAVGGCCGTTDAHVRQIAAAARMTGQQGRISDINELVDPRVPELTPAPGVNVTPTQGKGVLGERLGKKFVISVELNPPAGLSLEKVLESAKRLRDGGVDVINVADGARASARMGNIALCVRIQERVGLPALMHVTTRDRNLLGLLAHLLAAHELGVRNLVVITGDPPKMGNFPEATPVYDMDSVGLLRLVRGLNHGYDPGGKALGAATEFLCATGAEPAALDTTRELQRLEQKVKAGAELIMTQPVYDPAVLERFLGDAKGFGVPILVGLLPLASYRNAEFLHNEVPGMRVPDDIRERMRQAGNGPEAQREGVAIAREMLAAVKDRVAGAYIMPPFGRDQAALDVIKGIV